MVTGPAWKAKSSMTLRLNNFKPDVTMQWLLLDGYINLHRQNANLPCLKRDSLTHSYNIASLETEFTDKNILDTGKNTVVPAS